MVCTPVPDGEWLLEGDGEALRVEAGECVAEGEPLADVAAVGEAEEERELCSEGEAALLLVARGDAVEESEEDSVADGVLLRLSCLPVALPTALLVARSDAVAEEVELVQAEEDTDPAVEALELAVALTLRREDGD